MRRLTTLLVLCFVLTAGPAAAQNGEIGGWNQVFGPFTVPAGRATTFALARAEFIWTHNLTVTWGDGDSGVLEARDCIVGNSGCILVGTHTYTSPGLKRIDLTYSTCCFTYTATTTVIVDPDVGGFVHTPLPLDYFNVVSVGDSVASGEGNPETTTPFGPGTWSDATCHRSRLAGPWRAVNEILFNQNLGTDVNFDHRACSGANTADVMTQIQGINQPVDALLMSVGANDGYWYFGQSQEFVDNASAFATVTMNCLGSYDCSTDATLTTALNNKFDNMPRRYGYVANTINALPRPVTDVYIAEYYDPTRDNAGRWAPVNNTLNLVSPAEWEYLYDNVVVRLNNTLRTAAASHGWHVVGGIEKGFINHGYGAALPQRWVWLGEESEFLQGNFTGTAHPNIFGHMYYADRIARTINQQTAPRVVATPIGIFGDPVSPDGWVSTNVIVNLEARNLAGSGAVRMNWTKNEGFVDPFRNIQWLPLESGTVNETVFTNPHCDVLDSSNRPVPCHSELKTELLFSEEGRFSVSVNSTNAWGRTSTDTLVAVNIDKTPPRVGFGITPGWSRSPVTVWYSVIDDLSGVNGPQTGSVTVGEEPARVTVRDFARNRATYDVPVKVDLTPPVTTCSVSPSEVRVSYGKQVPLTVSVDVIDALSGPAGFVLTSVTSNEKGAAGDILGAVPGTAATTWTLRNRGLATGAPRVFTFTFTGADVAGHTSTCVADVTIRHDPGTMTGSGRVLAGPNKKYGFNFIARDRSLPGGAGHLLLETRDLFFDSDAVTAVTFAADPSSSVTFAGTGSLNGKRGYTFKAQAVDRGETGRLDSVAIVIRDAKGRIVMEMSGTLDSGDVLSHRLPPP